MPQTTVYHGTPYHFEKPDPRYFGEGDGRSVHGLGLYVAQYPEYAKEHLTDRIREGHAQGGAVYAMDMDIPEDRLFNRLETLKANDLDRYIQSAKVQGKDDLAEYVGKLKQHIANGTESTFQGKYMPVENGALGASRFQDALESHEGQVGASKFLKDSGIDALYTPNSHYSMYTVLNTDVIKGDLRLHETIGNGPLRNNPAKLVENKEFMSEELDRASRNVTASGSRDLQNKFDSLSAHLLSDPYNKRGLSAGDLGTYRQNDGFTLRDHLGTATQRFMHDGGLDNGHWGGAQSWDRFVQETKDIAGDDAVLMQKVEDFGKTLNTHNQKIHGISAPEKSLVAEFGKAADVPMGTLGRAAELTEHVARKAGPIAGVVLGVGAAGAAYMSTGSVAEAAEVGYETIVPYGETQIDLAQGDTTAAAKSAAVETGSWGGMVAGAASGTLVGGPVGGVVGGVVGGLGGGAVVDTLIDPPQLETISLDEAHKRLSGLNDDMVETMSPETQSLYNLKDNPKKFAEQYGDLAKTASIGEVSADLGRIVNTDDPAGMTSNLVAQNSDRPSTNLAMKR